MSRIFALVLVCGLLFLSGCPQQSVQPGAIAVWQQKEGGDWEIRYSVWDEASKKWYVPAGGITELIARLPGNDNDPYIDSNGKDSAISVWSHEEGGSSEIYYSIWKFDKWSTPQPVATVSGADLDPAVAMKNDGTAVAVWVHKNTDGTNTLYFSTYSSNGWGKPAQVARNLTQVSLPEISFSSTLGAYLLIFTKSTSAGTKTFASGYGKGVWAPPVEIPGQSANAVFDTNSPTSERIGLGAAGRKKEAIAVWPTTKAELYSSTWTPSGWSTAVKYGTEKMPDAEYEYGGVPYSVFIKGGNLHWSLDLYSAGGVKPVPGTGKDNRPALTFIGDRKTGLTVFWTTVASPSEIYYSRWDGAAWAPTLAIDPSFVPGEDRNPAIAPLLKEDQYWDIYFDWCGDGIPQWPNIWGQFEECEAGVPCRNPNDFCNDQCLCIPTYPSWCGDGTVQRPNSAGVMEECERDADCPAGQVCNLQTCKCETVTEPPPGDGLPPQEPPPQEPPPATNVCGNGKIEGNEMCDIGGALINGVRYGAAVDTCPMSQSCVECQCKLGIVTPYCGDGYISGQKQGANEECDLGGKRGAPVLPDTCPPPEKCSAICRCEEVVVEDGMHNICAEGGCIQAQGEGPDQCKYDYQCRHYECQGEYCVEVMSPGENTCLTDVDCRETHSECIEEQCVEVRGIGNDECESDSDCEITHSECRDEKCIEVSGEGQDECLFDSDCAAITYCGDGVVETPNSFGDMEECEVDSDCHGDEACGEDCKCYGPPELDCEDICSKTPGAELIAENLASSSECANRVTSFYQSMNCYTTCRYSWFYRVDNIAGYASCCCGTMKRFECSNQCRDCPGESICTKNAPSWYEPPD